MIGIRSFRLQSCAMALERELKETDWKHVKIKVVWIGKTKEPAIQSLTDEYLKRISRYADVEGTAVSDEDAFLKFRERSGTRPSYTLVLLDSRGRQFTSEGFAAFVQDHFAGKAQPLLFAIGGADGF